MREITRLPAEELEQKAERDEARIDRILREAVMRSGRKIVVLDDFRPLRRGWRRLSGKRLLTCVWGIRRIGCYLFFA